MAIRVEVPTSNVAPADATYITQTPNATLTAEQALSLLSTGYMKSTTGTGIISTQVVPIPVSDGGSGATTLTGYLKGNGITAFTAQATPIPIADGGTNGITALAAFNNLSPLTTRGDLLTRNATDNARLAVGLANRVLRSDGTDPSWAQVALGTDVSGVLPIANGGTNNSTAYTAGSVIFSDGTKLTQNNPSLFWDNTNNTFRVRAIVGQSSNILDIQNSGTTSVLYIPSNTNCYIGTRLGVNIAGGGSLTGMIDIQTNAAATVGMTITGTASQSGDYLRIINNQGTINNVIDSNNRFGIRVSSPVASIHINNPAGDNTAQMRYSDGDVAHGMTDILPTDVIFHQGEVSITTGGLTFEGMTSGDNAALSIRGTGGISSMTNAPLDFRAFKRNGTSRQAMGNTEPAFSFFNGSTEVARMLGSGGMGFGINNPNGTMGTRFCEIVTPSTWDNVALTIWNNDTTNGYGLQVVGGGTAAGRYAFHVYNAATTSLFYVGANGKCGIGTSSPTATLHGTVSTIVGCASSAIANADIGNSQVNIWVDETANSLTFKVKYSTGTVKSGTVSLV